jgi:hypothetical protein
MMICAACQKNPCLRAASYRNRATGLTKL